MMTAIQNAARPRSRHRIHANPFSVPKPDPMPNWDEAFGRKAPIALEIGFGIGGFLLDLGEKHPEWNVLGVEIRQHFVNGVLKQAGDPDEGLVVPLPCHEGRRVTQLDDAVAVIGGETRGQIRGIECAPPMTAWAVVRLVWPSGSRSAAGGRIVGSSDAIRE